MFQDIVKFKRCTKNINFNRLDIFLTNLYNMEWRQNYIVELLWFIEDDA